MVISLRTYLIILALLIVERIFELDLARRNARRAFERGAIEVGQAHYRVMVAFHTLFIASSVTERWTGTLNYVFHIGHHGT